MKRPEAGKRENRYDHHTFYISPPGKRSQKREKYGKSIGKTMFWWKFNHRMNRIEDGKRGNPIGISPFLYFPPPPRKAVAETSKVWQTLV